MGRGPFLKTFCFDVPRGDLQGIEVPLPIVSPNDVARAIREDLRPRHKSINLLGDCYLVA